MTTHGSHERLIFDAPQFAKSLREAMYTRETNIVALAELADCSPKELVDILAGVNTDPRISLLLALTEYMDTTIADFVQWEGA